MIGDILLGVYYSLPTYLGYLRLLKLHGDTVMVFVRNLHMMQCAEYGILDVGNAAGKISSEVEIEVIERDGAHGNLQGVVIIYNHVGEVLLIRIFHVETRNVMGDQGLTNNFSIEVAGGLQGADV